jgi:hypothetical protein
MTLLPEITTTLVQRGYAKTDADADGRIRPTTGRQWHHLPAKESSDGLGYTWATEDPTALYALVIVNQPNGEISEVHACDLFKGEHVASTDDLTGTLDDWLDALTVVVAAQPAEVDDIAELADLYPQGWRLADELLEDQS